MATDSERRALLRRVQEADFAALDLHLYLNTHPNCARAMQLFREYVNKGKECRAEYEAKFGPLTASATPNSVPWQWIDNPWTWEKED